MSDLHLFKIKSGKPIPFGATCTGHSTQFSVFSRNATAVSLLLFENAEDKKPAFELELDPRLNRTGDVWHILVEGVGPGQLYLYRVDGPFKPEEGHRFDHHSLLLDPYAKALTGKYVSHETGAASRKNVPMPLSSEDTPIPKCIVIENHFDWQGDKPLGYPLRFSIIQEVHVRGLTADPSSGAVCGVKNPGTFRGVIEMIPYFKELGITGLELLPIQEFNMDENSRRNPITGEQLTNFWGYSTMAFFAPKASYSSSGALGEQVTEFKEMVRELHKAGIEVILDVVFNHTAENDENGPTLSFKGLDNSIYYILDDDRRLYKNYTGCGNTLNCNHPTVRTLILDCLHYWVVEMHVDGFRFDLGSVLGRDRNGNLMENPPILERIAEDPILRNTKIIAEAWDAAGAYQVGWFPGGRWAEWNDLYRDDVRRFWRGDSGFVPKLCTRITGSSDLYLRDGRKPFHSINFITSHDGFTLHDLVSYAQKHNKENGEENRDGNDQNYSSNNGVEGETDNPEIRELRKRQIKNFLGTLFLSLGTPMLLGGDELCRTQGGNNNAYCQDNVTSWYNWELKRENKDIFRFCKEMIAFRARHPAFHRPEFYAGRDTDHNTIPDITWYNEEGHPLDWSNSGLTLALRIDGSKAEIAADRDDNDFFIIFNADREAKSFTICEAPQEKQWYLAIDTTRASPEDIHPPGQEKPLTSDTCLAGPRSLVVLISKKDL